jgi:hypothetical protein
LYGVFEIWNKVGFIAAFDIGFEQKSKGSNDLAIWYSPNIMVRYSILKELRVAMRTEYYQDRYGVIIPTGTVNGFHVLGYSLTFDYAPVSSVLMRLEGKTFQSKDQIFQLSGKPERHNYFLVSSISLSF